MFEPGWGARCLHPGGGRGTVFARITLATQVTLRKIVPSKLWDTGNSDLK